MKVNHSYTAVFLLLFVSTSITQADMQQQGTWSLEKLMSDIASVKTRSSRFTETKEISILEAAFTQSGILHFQSPDRLIKRILAPDASSFEIDGSKLTVHLTDKPARIVMLDDHPHMQAFFESLRAVLAGDLQALQRHFHTKLEGRPDFWTLHLTPTDKTLAGRISLIDIQGKFTEISQFITLEAAGDRTITTLEPIRD